MGPYADMWIKKEQLTRLAHEIGKNLIRSGAVLKGTEEQMFGKIEQVIQKNMEEEQKIEEEVKRLMEQYRNQMAAGSVDPQRVYQMIKKQVAKERKFVL